MLSMENEKDLQGSDKFRMGLVIGFIQMIQHVQEVFNISQVLGGHVVLPSDSVSVRIGSNCGNQT